MTPVPHTLEARRAGAASEGRAGAHATEVRLFLTCWLVLTLHFATNFVREHYPALALAEHGSFRVDEYVGLNPDIFVAPSGHAYITNNPGVSILAALPLFLARPALHLAEAYGRRQVERSGGQVSAVYEDDRPNRLKFYRQIRERGLDLKFGLVSFVTVAFLMSPLTALAGVVMLRVLRRLAVPPGEALLFALLSIFGTPFFFRNGYLNHNHVLGLGVFFGFVLLWHGLSGARRPVGRFAAAGFLGGFAVLSDYSGLISLAFLAAFAGLRAADLAGRVEEGIRRRVALLHVSAFAAGAALPLAALLAYQWAAFGSPLVPAQALMPPTRFSVIGQNGMTWPRLDLLLANLFDPTFGLFAFGPLLLVALAAPFVARGGWIPRRVTLLVAGYAAVLLLFCSANQFAWMQHNTGVRYLVPLVPFLFLYVVAVLRRVPRLLAYAIAVLAVTHAWAMAMVREDVPQSIARFLVEGFQLPFLTVLGKMAAQYMPDLQGRPSPLPLFGLCAAAIWGIWRLWPVRSRSDVREPLDAPTS